MSSYITVVIIRTPSCFLFSSEFLNQVSTQASAGRSRGVMRCQNSWLAFLIGYSLYSKKVAACSSDWTQFTPILLNPWAHPYRGLVMGATQECLDSGGSQVSDE
jgi:hypothetical protein